MGIFYKLKPGVPKRYLFFIAFALWAYAGSMLIYKGYYNISHGTGRIAFQYLIGIAGGIGFYFVMFSRLSSKYSQRIFRIHAQKPCLFSFFSGRSYIVMLIMIFSGLFIQQLEIINPLYFHTFYIVMGLPLLISSIHFLRSGLRYKHLISHIKEPGLEVKTNRSVFVKLFRMGVVGGLMLLMIMVFSHIGIRNYSEDFIYSDLNKIPANKVGLVLGTNKYLKQGWINPYFKYRIEAAVKLYKKGKIRYIIVSGDNSIKSYNEPRMMKQELVKRGIPANRIFLDYAGFRTLDSVVRCKAIFGQSSFTIISQEFHNERAVFIARKKNLNVVAFNSKDLTGQLGVKVKLREILARVKVVMDIYILHKQPKFFGPPVVIPNN